MEKTVWLMNSKGIYWCCSKGPLHKALETQNAEASRKGPSTSNKHKYIFHLLLLGFLCFWVVYNFSLSLFFFFSLPKFNDNKVASHGPCGHHIFLCYRMFKVHAYLFFLMIKSSFGLVGLGFFSWSFDSSKKAVEIIFQLSEQIHCWPVNKKA